MIAVVLLLYFVVVALIAVWASRRTRTARDFFVAGDSIGIWTLTIAAMTATLTGFTFIGGPGLFYTIGLGAMFIILPASLTNSMAAWVLAEADAIAGGSAGSSPCRTPSAPEYRSPAAQGLAAVAILIAIVGYMGTNLLALGIVIDTVFGTGFGWGRVWALRPYSPTRYRAAFLAGVYTDLFRDRSRRSLRCWYLLTYCLGGGVGRLSRTILARDPGVSGALGEGASHRWRRSPSSSSSGWARRASRAWSARSACLRNPAAPAAVSGGPTTAALLRDAAAVPRRSGVAVKAEVVAGWRCPRWPGPDDATLAVPAAPRAGAAGGNRLLRASPPPSWAPVNAFLNVGAAVVGPRTSRWRWAGRLPERGSCGAGSPPRPLCCRRGWRRR